MEIDKQRVDGILEQVNHMNYKEIALLFRVSLDRLCRLAKDRNPPLSEIHPCWHCELNKDETCRKIYEFYKQIEGLP